MQFEGHRSAAETYLKSISGQYYVYLLCRPDGRPFYVGKGINKRALEHEAEARRDHPIGESNPFKCNVIRKIIRDGGRLVYQIDAVFDAEFHLRDALRSGAIWLDRSHRYGDLRHILVPMTVARTMKLAFPSDPHIWLADRKARLADALARLGRAARNGTIPHGSIEDGTLRIDRLTDLLLEVDVALGFTDAFTHLRTGVPCGDRIGLLNVLLAEGLNLGLRKMAEACNTHDYWQISRLARWHVESEAIDQALATVVAAQGNLPMARVWGMGTTAGSILLSFSATSGGERYWLRDPPTLCCGSNAAPLIRVYAGSGSGRSRAATAGAIRRAGRMSMT